MVFAFDTLAHAALRAFARPTTSRALAQPLVLAEALIEEIAGAAHGADRVGGAAAAERAPSSSQGQISSSRAITLIGFIFTLTSATLQRTLQSVVLPSKNAITLKNSRGLTKPSTTT